MVGEGFLCVVLVFSSTVQPRSIVDTTYIDSIHERERGRCGDSGIHPRACCGRIAGVSRACRGRVALLDNINVSDISREFLAMSNLYSLVSTFTRIV
jgi:hypothetical protein